MSSPATLTDIILGTFMFVAFWAFIILTFSEMIQRLVRWLGSRNAEPDSVSYTLKEMYPDIEGNAKTQSNRDFFDVYATEAMRRYHQGGGHGK